MLAGHHRSVELLFFGRTGERRDARLAALDHRRHIVEVARADLLLVRDEGVAAITCRELGLLHFFDISRSDEK